MRINALFTLFIMFGCLSVFAQTEQKQKSYTYNEAIELLTVQDEFEIKGELPPIPSVGQQMHDARMKHNISLSTLSFVAGLTEETLIKIEEDRITPTRDIIAKIEDFLGEEIILVDL